MTSKAMATGELLSDLLTAVEGAIFNMEEGAYLEGGVAALEIIPVPVKGTDRYDLDIAVVPYGPAEDIDDDVLNEGRAAFAEAAAGEDPGIAAEARLRLVNLDRPSVRLEDLEGVLLFADELGEDGRTVVGTHPAFLDKQGHASVAGLPRCSCRLELMAGGHAGDVPMTDPRAWFRSAETAGRRASVIVGRDQAGDIVLEAMTSERALAGAKVRVEFVDLADGSIWRTHELTFQEAGKEVAVREVESSTAWRCEATRKVAFRFYIHG